VQSARETRNLLLSSKSLRETDNRGATDWSQDEPDSCNLGAVRRNHSRLGSAPDPCRAARNTSQNPWLGGQTPHIPRHCPLRGRERTHSVPLFLLLPAHAPRPIDRKSNVLLLRHCTTCSYWVLKYMFWMICLWLNRARNSAAFFTNDQWWPETFSHETKTLSVSSETRQNRDILYFEKLAETFMNFHQQSSDIGHTTCAIRGFSTEWQTDRYTRVS